MSVSGSDEPDFEELFYELRDLVKEVVNKNPTTTDSRLIRFLEENDGI